MARKLKETDPNVIEQYSGPPPQTDPDKTAPEVPLVPELIHHGSAVAAVTPTQPVSTVQPTGKPVATYRVGGQGGPILHRGVRTILKPGKIIDERMYDVPMLRTQGIILDPV
jgi:hypothetical protein